jgi:hypothetical protein
MSILDSFPRASYKVDAPGIGTSLRLPAPVERVCGVGDVHAYASPTGEIGGCTEGVGHRGPKQAGYPPPNDQSGQQQTGQP